LSHEASGKLEKSQEETQVDISKERGWGEGKREDVL
jgi:hypothetical protein